MSEEPGRREANKRATREALQQAADRLFAEQGYEQTTVRDIAAAAKVTPRTFFRYFGGKEELIVDEALSWLPRLTAAIRRRPAGEQPLAAVLHALADVSAQLRDQGLPAPVLLFADGPPSTRLRLRGPALLLRFEEGIAGAVLDRLSIDRTEDDELRYESDVYARAAVAAMRSAMIRDWAQRARGDVDPVPLPELMRTAFALVASA
ncbi:TetR family transcriptional regulator [Allobranchiibius sp. GilTou38]|uniref:TetR/AcrR family transcriptional regulator n=1 Tax=Allobranchiibius sp. GilTou38 TaxID=2815210 RepID=UPI001AA0C27B|nr:TetR family transcriptional regulator [Allobranchiibius sp. GilTou38]MBO1768345.1 TetR/AcrR family transcriptional regulator [Allobranchiibius sp. GilTou38]